MTTLNQIHKRVADKIISGILPMLSEMSISVFLCGKKPDTKESYRDKIKQMLEEKVYGTGIDVYYPEDIFEELLKGGSGQNLLDLENLLATSVHVVVILPESPGSFAELGAFANSTALKDKLLVVLDAKFKKDKSFINLGPIKFLKEKTNSIVYWVDEKRLIEEADKNPFTSYIFDAKTKADYILKHHLRHSVRKITDKNVVNLTLDNPIYAQNFIFACLHVFETLKLDEMKHILHSCDKGCANKSQATLVLSAALNILVYHKAIIISNGEYRLSRLGQTRLKRFMNRPKIRTFVQAKFDKLRVEYMNTAFRGGKYYKIVSKRAMPI